MKHIELIYEQTDGLAISSYAIIGEWLYFCDQKTPELFRYHIEKHSCEYVASFNRDFVNMNFLRMYAYKNELWMLPFLDGKIICYNTDTKKIFYYDIPDEVEEKQNPFIVMFFWKEKAYIVPYRNNRYLLIVDLQTHDIQKLKLMEIENQGDKVYFGDALQYGNKIYFTENSKSRLFIFCMDNYEMNIVCTESYLLEGTTLKLIENQIYFFPVFLDQKKDLVVYDILEENFSKQEYPVKNLPQGEVCITVEFEQQFWILANKARKIYQINKNLEIQKEISILNCNRDETIIYCCAVQFADRFFWNGYEGTPLIEVKAGKVQMLNVWENKNILEMYIEILNKNSMCEGKRKKTDIGKCIYDQVMSYEGKR